MENTRKTCLLFNSSWILTYFWHSHWHYFRKYFSKSWKTTLFRKPTEISQSMSTFISISLPIKKYQPFKKNEKFVFFWRLLFQMKKLLTFGISINQIFGKRFIIFKKMRYRGQLLLKLWTVELATSFHWISSRST